jgi:acetyl esterase/lipase
VLFYPVTDANFDTESYRQFATGYFLRRDAMQWFWDQYTTDPKQRAEITASPPPRRNSSLARRRALVLTGEADVRDEGRRTRTSCATRTCRSRRCGSRASSTIS